MTTQKEINLLSRAIIGYAIEVHKELGPGLLESIYEKCLEQVWREKKDRKHLSPNFMAAFHFYNPMWFYVPMILCGEKIFQ